MTTPEAKGKAPRPECADHPLGQHDGVMDPDGCGHCSECHDPDGECGHWIGCPGC